MIIDKLIASAVRLALQRQSSNATTQIVKERLIQKAVDKAIDSVKDAHAYTETIGPLKKQLGLLNDKQVEFVGRINETSKYLGISRTQLLQHTKAYLTQAGTQNGLIGQQISDIGEFAKGMGMDKSVAYNQIGHLANAGVIGKFGMDHKKLMLLATNAVSVGKMRGRESEVFSSINTLANDQLQNLVLPQINYGTFAAMNAMNQSEMPGLVGARGAGLMSKIGKGLLEPGGDEWGENFLRDALGKDLDVYEFQKLREEGALGKNENLSKILAHGQELFSDENERWYKVSKILKISMHQVEALEKALLSAKDGGKGFEKAVRKANGGDLGSTEKFGIHSDVYNAKNGKGEKAVIDNDSRMKEIEGVVPSSTTQENMKGVAEEKIIPTKEDAILTLSATMNQSLEKIAEESISIISEGVSAWARFNLDTYLENLRETNQQKHLQGAPFGAKSCLVPGVTLGPPNTLPNGRRIRIDEAIYGDFDISFPKTFSHQYGDGNEISPGVKLYQVPPNPAYKELSDASQALKSASATFNEAAGKIRNGVNPNSSISQPVQPAQTGDGNTE